MQKKLFYYVETKGTKEMRRKIDSFLKHKGNVGVHFKLDKSASTLTNLIDDHEYAEQQNQWLEESTHDDSEEFLEILRLRHSNLSK